MKFASKEFAEKKEVGKQNPNYMWEEAKSASHRDPLGGITIPQLP